MQTSLIAVVTQHLKELFVGRRTCHGFEHREVVAWCLVVGMGLLIRVMNFHPNWF